MTTIWIEGCNSLKEPGRFHKLEVKRLNGSWSAAELRDWNIAGHLVEGLLLLFRIYWKYLSYPASFFPKVNMPISHFYQAEQYTIGKQWHWWLLVYNFINELEYWHAKWAYVCVYMMVYLFSEYLVSLQIPRQGKTGLAVMEIRLMLSQLGKTLNVIHFWTLFYMSSN